jgi:hypothetical protein
MFDLSICEEKALLFKVELVNDLDLLLDFIDDGVKIIAALVLEQ